ncbi:MULTISPECIES: response regulator [Methylosinus]|uniref:DNA-binding response regulator n=1 Tax=Methylosinus trichosporium (strain ATCC 35070 / NCIMB 11131 / UNIQEM 75 / OB3b) TaxID=595536 RepID=A0A2D2D6Q5_METT3|nr:MULTISPECIES: response regulator transcription factor [Methylosinus]ATQ70701.1 DNA-binding response regulator [Methylosinus trichosporium OB3b]OBS52811.1 DNA-binding response regulator [Methylosinus sp. 3S-1]
MRILIVEDDDVLANGLKVGLELAGNSVDSVSTCADARAALASPGFDAVVLDLMLPDGSGIEILAELRRCGDNLPVLLLTALDEVVDRIEGLDAGADDYLGKPFDLDELAARIRAIVRRRDGRATPSLTLGGIVLDPADMSLSLDGAPVNLSRREFSVLAMLMEQPARIRSKSEIEDRIYGWGEEVESNAVEVHIHNLRAKLGRDAIETIRGLGYRMRRPK